jgi:hypothetical protein
MKSPLKSNIRFNVLNEIKKIIKPKSKISSFYLDCGDLELSLCELDHTLISHTNKPIIFEFWSLMLKDPVFFAHAVENVFSLIDAEQSLFLQSTWFMNRNELTRTVLFYILKTCSDHGSASAGKFDKNKINTFTLSKLKTFNIKNFYPLYDDCEDQLEAISSAKLTDFILLPIGKYSLNLFEYGKNKGPDMYTFKHKEIHARVKDLDKKCILLYKKHPALFNLYKSFNIKMVDKYGRVADKKESCEDLIITNF